MKNIRLSILVLAISMFLISSAFGYHKGTHEKITLYAMKNSHLEQNIAKINLLDLMDWKGVEDPLKYGSWIEDLDWDVRVMLTAHFYNPLTNAAGLNGTGESAYDKANNPTNNWSWMKAREYFYQGMTLTDPNQRKTAFGNMFEALGHSLHLVQDVSVPAHTRNDSHGYWESYESFTGTHDSDYLSKADYFSGNLNSVSPSAPKQFWDTDSYNGTVAYNGTSVGLAEYTNANFFSEHTIFSSDFPHPNKENTNYTSFGELPLSVITTPDKIEHNTLYVSGYETDRLAALNYFSDELEYSPDLSLEKPNTRFRLVTQLDNRCLDNYADKLIPRAVGYSAGLLDYFFRGEIGVSNATMDFPNLALTMINNAPAEEIGAGKVAVAYQYTDGSGNAVYGVSNETVNVSSISSSTPSNLSFTFADVIPYDAKNIKFRVVFRGQLGAEDDAVVASPFSIKEETGPAVVTYSGGSLTVDAGRKKYSKDITGDMSGYEFIRVRFAEGNPDILGILAKETSSGDFVVLKYKHEDVEYVYKGISARVSYLEEQGQTGLTIAYSYLEQTTDYGFTAYWQVEPLLGNDRVARHAEDIFITDGQTKIIGSYSVRAQWVQHYKAAGFRNQSSNDIPCDIAGWDFQREADYVWGIFEDGDLYEVSRRSITMAPYWSPYAIDQHGCSIMDGFSLLGPDFETDIYNVRTLSGNDYAYQRNDYSFYPYNGYKIIMSDLYYTKIGDNDAGSVGLYSSLIKDTGASIGTSGGSYVNGQFRCPDSQYYFLFGKDSEVFIIDENLGYAVAYHEFKGCDRATYKNEILITLFDGGGASDVTFMKTK